MRQSTSHQAGTLEAQSPPLMMPGLKLSGWLTVREVPMRPGALVPLGLEAFQPLDQVIGRLDGVGARAGARHMHGQAAHLEPEPDDADLGADQLAVGGLGNQAGIGPVAALQRGERAEPGALFLDHRLQVDAARGREPGRLQRVEGIERGDGAGLHIAGAAAVEPAVLDHGLVRRRVPHVERAGRHHVAVALQDQRAATVSLAGR